MKNKYEIRGDVTAIFIQRKNGEIFETIIDTEDIEKIADLTVSFRSRKYVSCRNKNTAISLHRLITDAPEGLFADHINGNTLDNRKCNLRLATNKENQQNRRGAPKNSRSGIRGVCWNKQAKRWKAQARVHGRTLFLGYFQDKHEAEIVVTEYRKQHMPFSEMDQRREGAYA